MKMLLAMITVVMMFAMIIAMVWDSSRWFRHALVLTSADSDQEVVVIVIRMVVASISRRPPLPRRGQIKVVFSTCPNRDQNLSTVKGNTRGSLQRGKEVLGRERGNL